MMLGIYHAHPYILSTTILSDKHITALAHHVFEHSYQMSTEISRVQ